MASSLRRNHFIGKPICCVSLRCKHPPAITSHIYKKVPKDIQINGLRRNGDACGTEAGNKKEYCIISQAGYKKQMPVTKSYRHILKCLFLTEQVFQVFTCKVLNEARVIGYEVGSKRPFLFLQF
ncbi:MAG: hypothetical protein JWQ40_3151 [Segetibacter sp.]|nr:hypothetical protein [Segetibacter sp.]